MLKGRVQELEEKYFNLVWLARKSPEDIANSAVIRREVRKVRQKYPKEVLDLLHSDGNNWQHGFNSGMLACLRLIMSYLDEDPEEIARGEEEFPFLDT